MTTVDYNEKNGRFIIASPPWDVGRMRSIPNRKWDSKNKVWTAPAIRVNAEYIRDRLKDATVSDTAHDALIKALTGKKPVANRFPLHYKFKTSPYNHQMVALNKAYENKSFALFMDMRTGKSKTAIDCASAYRIENKVDTVLIVCPYSIRRNWDDQWSEHCPLPYTLHVLDTNKKQLYENWLGAIHEFKVLVVGVESLAAGSAAKMTERFLLTSIRAMMIIDESHTIKNHSANRAKVCTKLGNMAEYRMIMTGTSTANGPLDLFMQFEFLDPSIIGVGDYYSFRNRYAVMGGYEDRQVIGYQNMDELMELVAPFTYEVSRDDVFDIPSKQYAVRTVKMSPQQKEMYDTMAKNKYIDSDHGVLTAQTVLEKMLRLQEISGGTFSTENSIGGSKFIHHRIPGGTAKVEEVINIAEECSCNIIVWCVRRMEIEMIVEALSAKYGNSQVVEIHGGIDGDTRHSNVYDKFQTKTARFLVGTPSAGGMSYKMSAAGIVIYYSNSFNYVDRRQSEDRTQSSDQINSVMYIDLVTEGSVDELVLDALANKQNVSDYVKTRIGEISKRVSGQ